jgi:hypothetical protein
MKHYVVYHDADTMDHNRDEAAGFVAITRKGMKNLVGETIWVIEGRDTPKRFHLTQRFIAERVEEDHHSAGLFVISGSHGTRYLNEPELNELTWFPAFRKAMGNFSVGIQPVSDRKLVNALKKVLPGPAVAAPKKILRRPAGVRPSKAEIPAEPEYDIDYAISIRQPYAEQILQGVKRFEYRQQHTRIRERVWIFADSQPAESDEEWTASGFKVEDLPTGVIVGSVEIADSKWDEERSCFAYALKKPQRLATPFEVSDGPRPGLWKAELRR